jgi:hypothetical protein
MRNVAKVVTMTDLAVEHSGEDLTNAHSRSSAREVEPPMAPIERLPKWLLCIPLVAQWLWLALIHRSATLPSVLNPGIETGGLVGESKFSYLAPIDSRLREWVAETHPVAPDDDALEVRRRYGLEYPLIAKPDIGWCGYGVRRIDCDDGLSAYAGAFPRGAAFLLQRFAHERNEAGVLYVREPGAVHGRVTALTVRHSPHVVGDGASTVEQLIAYGERTGSKAARYRMSLSDDALARVPALGERVELTTVASVRVGGRYEDQTRLITRELDATVDAIARAIGDFHYGRFDVKFETMRDLQEGRFTIIEINGAGSEAIQFWDPRLSMVEAFEGVFAKQRNLFALADAMRRRGLKPVGWRKLAAAYLRQQRLVRRYPDSN